MIRFGLYSSQEELSTLIEPLVALLDGRTDVFEFWEDHEKQENIRASPERLHTSSLALENPQQAIFRVGTPRAGTPVPISAQGSIPVWNFLANEEHRVPHRSTLPMRFRRDNRTTVVMEIKQVICQILLAVDDIRLDYFISVFLKNFHERYGDSPMDSFGNWRTRLNKSSQSKNIGSSAIRSIMSVATIPALSNDRNAQSNYKSTKANTGNEGGIAGFFSNLTGWGNDDGQAELSPLEQHMFGTFAMENEFGLQRMCSADIVSVSLDLLLYDHPQLVSNALQLVYRHYNQHDILLSSLQRVQLLVAPELVDQYDELRTDLDQFRQLGETTEIWLDMRDPEDFEKAEQASNLLSKLCGVLEQKSLIDQSKSSHSERIKKIEKQHALAMAKETQRLMRSLGAYKLVACMLRDGGHFFGATQISSTRDAVESGQEDQLMFGNQAKRQALVSSIFYKCYSFLILFTARSPRNQSLLASQIEIFVEHINLLPQAANLIQTIYSGNTELCMGVKEDIVHSIINQIAISEPESNLLLILRTLVQPKAHESPLRRNQIIVFNALISAAHSKKILRLLDPSSQGHTKILEMCEEDPENNELQYYVSLLDLLAVCTRTKSPIFRSKCQSILSILDITKFLRDHRASAVLRAVLITFFSDVYLSNAENDPNVPIELAITLLNEQIEDSVNILIDHIRNGSLESHSKRMESRLRTLATRPYFQPSDTPKITPPAKLEPVKLTSSTNPSSSLTLGTTFSSSNIGPPGRTMSSQSDARSSPPLSSWRDIPDETELLCQVVMPILTGIIEQHFTYGESNKPQYTAIIAHVSNSIENLLQNVPLSELSPMELSNLRDFTAAIDGCVSTSLVNAVESNLSGAVCQMELKRSCSSETQEVIQEEEASTLVKSDSGSKDGLYESSVSAPESVKAESSSQVTTGKSTNRNKTSQPKRVKLAASAGSQFLNSTKKMLNRGASEKSKSEGGFTRRFTSRYGLFDRQRSKMGVAEEEEEDESIAFADESILDGFLLAMQYNPTVLVAFSREFDRMVHAIKDVQLLLKQGFSKGVIESDNSQEKSLIGAVGSFLRSGASNQVESVNNDKKKANGKDLRKTIPVDDSGRHKVDENGNTEEIYDVHFHDVMSKLIGQVATYRHATHYSTAIIILRILRRLIEASQNSNKMQNILNDLGATKLVIMLVSANEGNSQFLCALHLGIALMRGRNERVQETFYTHWTENNEEKFFFELYSRLLQQTKQLRKTQRHSLQSDKSTEKSEGNEEKDQDDSDDEETDMNQFRHSSRALEDEEQNTFHPLTRGTSRMEIDIETEPIHTQVSVVATKIRSSTQQSLESLAQEETLTNLTQAHYQELQLVERILRFLQLLCEGHYLDIQRYLIQQSGSNHSVDLVSATVNFLVSLSSCVDKQTAFVANQCFDSLTEYCQGPCNEAQLCVSSPRFLESVNTLVSVEAIKHLDEDSSRELRSKMVVTLLSLIEGRDDNVVHIELANRLNMFSMRSNLTDTFKYFREKYPSGQYTVACAEDPYLQMGFNIYILFVQLSSKNSEFQKLISPKIVRPTSNSGAILDLKHIAGQGIKSIRAVAKGVLSTVGADILFKKAEAELDQEVYYFFFLLYEATY